MSSPTADPGALDRGALGLGPPGLRAEDILRRRKNLGRWKRRSVLVRVMRVLLPALCLAIVLGLAGLATTALIARAGAHRHGQLAIRMLKPHFQGRNEQGKPFLVTADSAVRDDVDSARITLDNPVFTQGAGPGDQSKVRSRHGVYREDTRMLDLRGNVVLDDAQGYHFVSEHAVVDTVKSNVDGDTYISGHGPLGQISASSYAVRNGGAYLYFVGKVKTRIEHGGAQAAAGQASNPPAGEPAH